jgi:murein DD-endopeptidase MepM/ murein hydrolase activator NlpD
MRRLSRRLVAGLFVLALVPWANGPALAAGEYFLPAPPGVSLSVTQGNSTGTLGGDHAGTSEFAWDFSALEGAPFEVAASRAGIVTAVRSDVLDGNCPPDGRTPPACWSEANHVVIDHLDGTAALYLHLAQGSSASLAVGSPVALGQILGLAGSSGTTGGAQLHFMVMAGISDDPLVPGWWRPSVPVTFADESVMALHPDGIPGNGVTPDGPFVSANPGPGVVPPTTPGEPIARPASLPARLPWSAGESHSIAQSSDPAVPGGLGFEVVSAPGSADPVTTQTLAFPIFGGAVRYAGCATGANAGLGRIAIIERDVDGRLYQALYAHLSTLDPALTVPAGLEPLVVSASQPIGTFGSTITGPEGTCDGVDGGAPRLLFALYEDALVSPTGQIQGGTPVQSGTFVGAGAYERLPWWQGPMRAIDISDKAGLPSASWASGTTADRSHVFLGDPVTLSVQARSAADLREVRFITRYEGWPVRRALGAFPGLDPDRTWRILAVCRPPGVRGEPRSTKGCQWNGTPRRATVTFRWDPRVAEKRGLVSWLPPGRAAIGERSKDCVPATFSWEVYDTAGYQALEPRGRIAFKCDAQGPRLGRSVSLDPLRPPTAPTNVRLSCPVQEELGCVENLLTWRRGSPNEEGLKIYAEKIQYLSEGWPKCKVKEAAGPVLIATLPAGKLRWTPGTTAADKAIGKAVGGKPWFQYELSISAVNDAGESPRTRATGGEVYVGGDVVCEPT